MKRYLRRATLLLLLLPVSGCGLTSRQVASTQSFGTATSGIGKFSEAEFTGLRKGIIRMNAEFVAIDTSRTAKELLDDMAVVSAEKTAKRIAAAKALSGYGDLLVKLSAKDNSANIRKSADTFVTNAGIALKQGVSSSEQGAISQLLAGLGTLLVENRKADAVKKIVLQYEQPVNKLAGLLRDDFSLDGDGGYLAKYELAAKKLKNASTRLLRDGSRYRVLERARAAEALILSEDAIDHVQAVSVEAGAAVDNLRKANAELVRAIRQEEYSTDDIAVYARQVQNLANLYQVLVD